MNNNMYRIEFNGGPKDGLLLEVGFVPSRTLYAKAPAAQMAADSAERRHSRLAKYELARTRVGRDANGLPVVDVRYGFVGAETRPHSLREQIVSRLSQVLPLPSNRWMSNCRAKLAAWMLTPVDYPLNTRRLVSNYEQSPNKLVPLSQTQRRPRPAARQDDEWKIDRKGKCFMVRVAPMIAHDLMNGAAACPPRTIAIGDIHGCAETLRRLLANIAPTSADTIVTLGDYVDRGPDSQGVLETLIQLRGKCRLVPAARQSRANVLLRPRQPCDVKTLASVRRPRNTGFLWSRRHRQRPGKSLGVPRILPTLLRNRNSLFCPRELRSAASAPSAERRDNAVGVAERCFARAAHVGQNRPCLDIRRNRAARFSTWAT